MGESIKSFRKEEICTVIARIRELHNLPRKPFSVASPRRLLESALRSHMKAFKHSYYEFNGYIKPKVKRK